MITDLRNLLGSRELLYMLTWRDIQIRYKQSIMGLLWAILMPSLIVGAGAIVRVGMARVSGTEVSSEDIASVMVRAVVWALFIASLRFGTNSLLTNTNLVTKLAFPKEVFPVAAVFSNLFDFVIAAGAITLVLLLIGWVPSWHAIWLIPLLLALLMLTIGLTLILSAANLFFRDVKYLVEVAITYAIFFTPVLYDVGMTGKWRNWILLNPVAPLLEGLSDAVVMHRMPDPAWTTYSIGFSVLILLVGYWLFKQLEPKFAESI